MAEISFALKGSDREREKDSAHAQPPGLFKYHGCSGALRGTIDLSFGPTVAERDARTHHQREGREEKAPALARRDELLKEENLLLTRERG